MIEKYWDEVFGEFKLKDGRFEIPGLPEPLMSAHFGVKNIIGKTDKKILQSFKLCTFKPLSSITEKTLSISSLGETISNPEFWAYQMAHNSNAVPFLNRLLPFLLTLKTPHHHFYLRNESGIYASALIGEATSGAFLFNLSIRPSERGQKISNVVLRQIRGSFPKSPCFYWTVHPWFTFDAQVEDYHLVN